jgi:hypothetical protein
MTKNKLSDLRDHLFETLEALKDKESPMEIQRAKAIADVAQAIINSATVEVKAAQTFDRGNVSDFFGTQKTIEESRKPVALPPANGRSIRPTP